MTATPDSDALIVDVQFAVDEQVGELADPLPSEQQLSEWARTAYTYVHSGSAAPAEITIRIVDSHEMAELNEQYRGKQGLTNVLSFPFEFDQTLFESNESDEQIPVLLGDLVICHTVVVEESYQQSKRVLYHYAHMVVHGVLHLCGYDHQTDKEAVKMESLETSMLASLDIPNPYLVNQTPKK